MMIMMDSARKRRMKSANTRELLMSEHIWLYTACDGVWERDGASSVGFAASARVGPFSSRGIGFSSGSMVNLSTVRSSSSKMRV